MNLYKTHPSLLFIKKYLSVFIFSTTGHFVFAQVAQDACGSALSLTIGTNAVSTNSGATTVASDPFPFCVSNSSNNNTVWYKFTPAANGTVTFTLTHGSIRWASLGVYSGTCGSFTELGCNEATTSTGNTTLAASCLTGGTTYYVMIYNDGTTPGTFTLSSSFTAGGIPANDACTAATNLGTAFTTTTVAGNNSCATVDNDVACFSASNNVWYKFTTGAGAGYVATFTLTTGTLTYPVIAVFSGSCGAFSSVTCNDPFTSSGPITATANCLTPNTTYYVVVDDDFGTAGTFSLTTHLAAGISGAPANDNCSGATNLGTAFTNTAVAGNSTCATADNDVAGCFTANQNLWYKFTTGASAGYVATFTVTTGSLSYPNLDVFAGTCATFSEMSGACTDPGTAGTITATVTCLAPNTTYYVEVDNDSFSGTPGTFTLTTHLAAGTGVPTNDNCSGATNLGTAFTNTVVTGTNVCASADNDVASCFTANNNVWYKFTTGALFTNATFTLTTPGTGANLIYPVLDIYSGTCGSLTEIVCNDPFTSAGPVNSTASCLSPNTTYYIEVDDDFGTPGTFSLTTHLAAAVITCSGIPAGGTSSPNTTTVSCTPGSVALALSGEATGCGVTYQWQTSANNSTWTNITGATQTSYTAASVSALTYIKCVVTCNSITSASSSTSTISVSASPGVNGVPTCSLAPVVTTGFGCGNNTTAPTTDPGYWPSVSQFTCDGSIDNLLFQQFQTNSIGGTVSLIVNNIACINGEGVQAALFDPTTTCTSSGWGTALFCYDGSDVASYTLTMTALLPNHTYYLVFDGYAGAECTWGTQLTGNVVLPIELLSFTGSLNNNKVDLKWNTASETNNNYFTIERSADGYNFEEITQVKGAGNSTKESDYTTIDYFPLAGLSYYRLSQTDFNGNLTRLNIIPITNYNDDGMFKLMPNPMDGIVNVEYSCGTATTGILNVYNCNGQLQLSKDITCITGNNKTGLNLEDKASGIYFVTFTTNDKFYHIKLIKK